MSMNQTDHCVDGTKRPLRPNTSPHHSAVEAKRQRPQDTPTTYDRTWTIDQGGVPQREKTAIRPGAIGTISPGPKTAYGRHPNSIVTSPDTEALHTPYASLMR